MAEDPTVRRMARATLDLGRRARARAAATTGFLQQRRSAAASGLTIVLHTSVPTRAHAARWGDWPFAGDLGAALVRRGHTVLRTTRADATAVDHLPVDVAVHLHGRATADTRTDRLDVAWLISHPEDVADTTLSTYDAVLVASIRHAMVLDGRLTGPVLPLLQATDATRFVAPDPRPAVPSPAALYVANGRTEGPRTVVAHARATGVFPTIYGANWERWLDPSRIAGERIPNGELPGAYGRAGVVLNDHWHDMRRLGFMSNRIFDAAACGTAVLSDEVDGLDEVFGGAVPTYDSAASYAAELTGLTDDDERRRALGDEAARIVRRDHTFDARAEEIERVVRTLL